METEKCNTKPDDNSQTRQQTRTQTSDRTEEICPDCGNRTYRAGNCPFCPCCGWSDCC